MAPKCAMSALPPPCEQLKTSMLEMGAGVNLDGLRGYVDRHGAGLVRTAFNAYQRQLLNWWPETLLTRYHELPRQRGADDARRQCLLRYLLNPSSGGFPRDDASDLFGEKKADDGQPPAKVQRVDGAGFAGADPEPPSGQHATPTKATPVKPTPTKASPMDTLTPQRSPAVLLATSVRSTGSAARIQLSPGPRETDGRWLQGPWSQDLRESVTTNVLCAQADEKAVGWYKAFAEKRVDDPQYRPSKRGADANMWKALNRFSTNGHPGYEMDVPTVRLFALQPDMLGGAGAKFYGEASEEAPWRWTFRAAAEHHGIDALRDVEGPARRTRQAALAERLDAVKVLYAADQEAPRPDPVRAKRVAQVLTAWADFRRMSHAHADSFSFAKERVFDFFACVTDDLSNLYLTSVCMPNFGNTCFLNAVVQALIHCKPWRLRDVSIQMSPSFRTVALAPRVP